MLFLGPDRHYKLGTQDLYGMDVGQEFLPHRKYPSQQLAGSAYWVPEDLFLALLEAILGQLSRAGFRIVVGHGHGPSTKFFLEHAPDWRQKFNLICLSCWGSPHDQEGLGIQVDHAAMNETSLMMALYPERVQMDPLPSDLNSWPLAIGGKDPRIYASPERGEKIIALQKERMAKILQIPRQAKLNLAPNKKDQSTGASATSSIPKRPSSTQRAMAPSCRRSSQA